MPDKPDRSFRNDKKTCRREEAKQAVCALIDEGLPGNGKILVEITYYQGGLSGVQADCNNKFVLI